MGMAASQARYLGLTARKTNVEYEGQQINQARVALANQSADAFNQYLSLQAPVPPSTEDYKSTSYVYTDGNKEYTLEDYTRNSTNNEYPYVATVSYKDYRYEAAKNTKSGVQIKTNEDNTSRYDDVGNYYPYVIMTSSGLKTLREVDLQAKSVDLNNTLNQTIEDDLNNQTAITYNAEKGVWEGVTADNNPKIDAYGTGEANKYLFTYNSTLDGYVSATVTDINGNERALVSYDSTNNKINILDGYEAKITTKTWAALAKCSKDTAQRDIHDLVEKDILREDIPGAKRPSYSIIYDPEDITAFFSEAHIEEENGCFYLKALYKGRTDVCERVLTLDAERFNKGDLPLGNLLAKYCSYLRIK